jgi:hypothetical protein
VQHQISSKVHHHLRWALPCVKNPYGRFFDFLKPVRTMK